MEFKSKYDIPFLNPPLIKKARGLFTFVLYLKIAAEDNLILQKYPIL
jgi:hypothetical protein